MKLINYLRWVIAIFFLHTAVYGQVLQHTRLTEKVLIDILKSDPAKLVKDHIQEAHIFYGLASYYNSVNYFLVDGPLCQNSCRLKYLHDSESVELNNSQWLVVVGHFNVLLIQANNLSVHLNHSILVIDNPAVLNQIQNVVRVVSKPELSTISPELDQIRYVHLWEPLAWLARLVESALVSLHANGINNWGWAIVVFSVLLKLVLLPVSVMTIRFQRRVSQVQSALAPRVAEIKVNYTGEEAHDRLMLAHKKMGVSPFYTLKPMLGSLIQVPVLIAVFNALGEMPQLAGQHFLWISDLAYPDSIASFSTSIPMLGDTLSILPFIMTFVTVLSTVLFQNKHALSSEVKSQKRNLYLMAIVFFVLFYPFPAAMVLYWVLANILQTLQQQIIKI